MSARAACPDPDSLLDFVEGRASYPETIEAHIDDCAECQWVLAKSAGLEEAVWPVPGDTLGRYEVERTLGAGAMGVVFAARDPQLRRTVAVKLWVPERDFDPERNRSRLLAEARSMARLAHPNVVPVYDVGTERDAVFIAMEYVSTGTLAQWLEQPRPWRDVARVMAAAGEGIAAAHDAGIIHRDFKPANVLLAPDGRVLVADFGLAIDDRVRSARATDDLTQSATGPAGTPMYMSPEQLRGERGDSHSDQFAFCVTLYEALYGHHPFRASTVDALLLQQEARLGDSPDPNLPPWLHDAVRRGLSPDPQARFPSMHELVAALRPPARKRRLPIVLGVAASAALVFAAAWSPSTPTPTCDGLERVERVWGDQERAGLRSRFAQEGRPKAAAGVVANLDEYAQAWAGAFAAACSNGAWTESHQTCLAQRHRELGALVDVLTDGPNVAIGDAAAAANRLSPPSDCVERANRTWIESGPEAAPCRDVLARMDALIAAGATAEALAAGRDIESTCAQFDGARAQALSSRGVAHLDQADYDEAESDLRAALELASEQGHDYYAMHTATDLAQTAARTGRFVEAKRWLRQAEAIEARFDAGTAMRISVLRRRALIAEMQGDFEEQVEISESALALTEDEDVGAELAGRVRFDLARAMVQLGRYDRAEELWREVLPIARAEEGPTSPWVVGILGNLASVAHGQGRDAEAVEQLRKVLPLTIDNHGESHPSVGVAYAMLGAALKALGELDEARANMDRAVEVFESACDGPCGELPSILAGRAGLLIELGAVDRAVDDARRAVALSPDLHGPDHPRQVDHLGALADAMLAAGDQEAALAAAREALALAERALPETHPTRFSALVTLGDTYLELDRPADAVPHFERAVALTTQLPLAPDSIAHAKHALEAATEQQNR